MAHCADLIDCQSQCSLCIIPMAWASRDAIFCVSQAMMCLFISCFIARSDCAWLLVRRNILRLYFGRMRYSLGFYYVSALGCGRYVCGYEWLWNGHVMMLGHYFRSRCLRSCDALCGIWCDAVEAMHKYAGMRNGLCNPIYGNSK